MGKNSPREQILHKFSEHVFNFEEKIAIDFWHQILKRIQLGMQKVTTQFQVDTTIILLKW